MNGKPMIRYDANGIPNFIKGENLSTPLETDPIFENLKKKSRSKQVTIHLGLAQK